MRSDRFCVVPPGPVSDRTDVELRATVENTTDAARDLDVTFTRDGEEIARTVVNVPARGRVLASAWMPTAGLAGARTLSFDAGPDQRGETTLEIVASQTRALPRISAAWIDSGSFGVQGYVRDGVVEPDDLRDIVDAIGGLGMSTIVLTYLEFTGEVFYPSAIRFHDYDIGRDVGEQTSSYDLVEVILDQAGRNGMHVFMGLGRGGDTPLLWEFDEPGWGERNARGVKHTIAVADELWSLYSHHPSFYGWYLTHEMNDLARASAYYDPIARHCHSLAPHKPVLAAPAGTPIADTAALAASEVDIFAYQDAVGAGYVPYEYTWDPERRLVSLDEIYRAYARAHRGSGKHFWSDLETWEMNGSVGYTGAYPPSFDRVRRQIEVEAPHVDWITAYEYTGFFQHPGARVQLREERAHTLYDDYHSYVKGL